VTEYINIYDFLPEKYDPLIWIIRKGDNNKSLIICYLEGLQPRAQGRFSAIVTLLSGIFYNTPYNSSSNRTRHMDPNLHQKQGITHLKKVLQYAPMVAKGNEAVVCIL